MKKSDKKLLYLLVGTSIVCGVTGTILYYKKKKELDTKRKLRNRFLSNIKCYAEYAIENNNIMEICVEQDAFGVWQKITKNETTGESKIEVLSGKDLDNFSKYIYDVSDVAVRHIPNVHEGYGAMKLDTGSLVYIPGKDLFYLIPDEI